MKTLKKHLLLLATLLVIFTSCQKAPKGPVQQRLNINIPSDPATLDPRKGGDLISSLFHFLLFDGLYRLNDEGRAVPSLSDEVIISEDRTVYTFHLREAYWSDGNPVTAWDFEKSWKDILSPDFPAMNAHLLYPIKHAEGAKTGTTSLSEVGIKSLDAKTLEVTLERPTPYFLELIAFCVFYPVNAELDHSHPEWDNAAGKGFVCSGPFTLKEWRRNNDVMLAKNENYLFADKVALEEIHINVVENEMTSLQMYEKGEIDILGQPLVPLPTDAIPELRQSRDLYTHHVPGTTFTTFNVKTYPFSNKHIRRAMAYAINRREIVENITQLNELAALSAIPPVLKRGDNKAFFHDFDTEAARDELALGLQELGIPLKEFPQITYLYSTAEANHKVAQALQQQWADVLGIHVELEAVGKKILLHHFKAGSYQIGQAFWMAQYRDPMNILDRFKYADNVKNYPNWENETYIELINASQNAITDEERFAILDEAETVFLEDMPLTPIYHWNSAYIAKPYVKSYSVAPIGDGFFDRVYIDVEAKEHMR